MKNHTELENQSMDVTTKAWIGRVSRNHLAGILLPTLGSGLLLAGLISCEIFDSGEKSSETSSPAELSMNVDENIELPSDLEALSKSDLAGTSYCEDTTNQLSEPICVSFEEEQFVIRQSDEVLHQTSYKIQSDGIYAKRSDDWSRVYRLHKDKLISNSGMELSLKI